MGTHMSAELRKNSTNMEVKSRPSRLAQDVRKLTSAASRLRIHKRKDKVAAQSKVSEKQSVKNSFNTPPSTEKKVDDLPAPVDTTRTQAPTSTAVTTASTSSSQVPQQKSGSVSSVSRPPPLPSKSKNSSSSSSNSKGLPQHIVAATRIQRKWTLTDLLQNFGVFVQKKCSHLHSVPSASEVSMWVRCADRALQLNGWTINSFLLESHVVFSYMLVACAFEKYEVRTLADAKELVLLCLYVSYTYNANEISYPLRPFLVKQDRSAFWDKCTDISLSCSGMMLRLNRDRGYYLDTLASLKCIHAFC